MAQHHTEEELFQEKTQLKLIDGSYASRYLAKNIVSAGVSEKCLIQLAYVIEVKTSIDFIKLAEVDEFMFKKKKIINNTLTCCQATDKCCNLIIQYMRKLRLWSLWKKITIMNFLEKTNKVELFKL